MDLTGFIDIDVQNAGSMSEFIDLNAMTHHTVNLALLDAGILVDQFPLWSPEMTHDWLDIHYKEHLAWADALGLPLPPDLNDVDLNDEAQMSDWLNNHANVHTVINLALGL